jgi:hypothetical protein
MNRLRAIRLSLLFAGISIFFISGTVVAEQRNQRMDWERLRQLLQNTSVKILVRNEGAIQGKWISADEVSALILADKMQRTVKRDDMLQIYQKHKSSRIKHALLGTAIGAGGGLGAGAIVDACIHDDWFPNGGKQVLTPLGAIIGTIIGIALPTGRWQEIYRAPSLLGK